MVSSLYCFNVRLRLWNFSLKDSGERERERERERGRERVLFRIRLCTMQVALAIPNFGGGHFGKYEPFANAILSHYAHA